MLQCQSFPKQLEALSRQPGSLSHLKQSGPQISCASDTKNKRVGLESPQVLFARRPRQDPSRTILHGCDTERICHILAVLGWLKSYCMNLVPFNLLKTVLLLRAPFEIVLLSGPMTERAFRQTVIWDVRSPNHTTPDKACISFFLVGQDIEDIGEDLVQDI